MAPTSVTRRPSSISKPGPHVTCEIHGLLALCRTVEKKLYRYRPDPEPILQTRTTKTRITPRPCDPTSIERGVRQALADKVTGNLSGVWLLAPELLRLGAWDLLCDWTAQRPEAVGPRLALQLIHESALCVAGLR